MCKFCKSNLEFMYHNFLIKHGHKKFEKLIKESKNYEKFIRKYGPEVFYELVEKSETIKNFIISKLYFKSLKEVKEYRLKCEIENYELNNAKIYRK